MERNGLSGFLSRFDAAPVISAGGVAVDVKSSGRPRFGDLELQRKGEDGKKVESTHRGWRGALAGVGTGGKRSLVWAPINRLLDKLNYQ